MRKVRVLSVSCHITAQVCGAERLDLNRRLTHLCLERAGAFDPDFVVFPEIVLHRGVGPTPEALAYAGPVPGRTTEEVAERARALKTHVLLPLLERSGDKVFNSVAFIGRQGGLHGVYRK